MMVQIMVARRAILESIEKEPVRKTRKKRRKDRRI